MPIYSQVLKVFGMEWHPDSEPVLTTIRILDINPGFVVYRRTIVSSVPWIGGVDVRLVDWDARLVKVGFAVVV